MNFLEKEKCYLSVESPIIFKLHGYITFYSNNENGIYNTNLFWLLLFDELIFERDFFMKIIDFDDGIALLSYQQTLFK